MNSVTEYCAKPLLEWILAHDRIEPSATFGDSEDDHAGSGTFLPEARNLPDA